MKSTSYIVDLKFGIYAKTPPGSWILRSRFENVYQKVAKNVFCTRFIFNRISGFFGSVKGFMRGGMRAVKGPSTGLKGLRTWFCSSCYTYCLLICCLSFLVVCKILSSGRVVLCIDFPLPTTLIKTLVKDLAQKYV